MELLTIKNLCKNINKKEILKDISIEIPYGKVIALVGKNGAGKTSLLKTVSELYVHKIGKIRFLGNSKKFIFDTPPQLTNLTVKEYINLFNMLYTNSSISLPILEEIIEMLSLKSYISKKVSTLSFGMQKKLYLSTILLGQSELIILDEPFNGLDFEAINLFKKILKEYHKKSNCTIIISSHHLQELSDICDTICMVDNGKIVNYTLINDIKANVIINSCKIRELENFFKNIGTKINYINKKSLSICINDSIFELIKTLVDNNIYFEEIYFDNPLREGMKNTNEKY